MVIYVDLCRYILYLLPYFVPTSIPADRRFLYPTLIVSSRSGASGDFGAGPANLASGETCSCCCSAIPSKLFILSNQPPNTCWTSLKLSRIYNAISSISIPFMPNAGVFYFHLKIFSMLSCCKCESQISNMINSSWKTSGPQPGRQAHPTVPPLAPPNSGRFG